jgi:sugar phosphate permease
MMTLGGDFAPPETRGEFLGVWRFIGDIGATGAPLIVGVVAQVLVLQAAVFAIAGFGFGTALWFGLLVPETLRRETAAAVVVD